MIDKNKLPTLTRDLVEKVLLPSLPRANYDAMTLLALYSVSRILCYNRVKICSDILETRETSANIYAMSLSHSGNGKDKSKRVLEEIFQGVNSDIKGRQARWFEREKERVENEAEAKFGASAKAKQKEYISTHGPRTLRGRIASNSTPEGFFSQREAFFKAAFGCTSWEDSEIFDSIEERGVNGTFGALVSSVKQAFDHGFTEAKVTKGDKYSEDIDGVPQLMFVHGACGDDFDSSYLKKFFDLGFARRCLIFVEPKRDGYVKLTPQERRSLIREKNIHIDSLKRKVQRIYDDTLLGPPILLTEEAEDMCFEYEESNGEAAFNSSGGKGVKADYTGRDWKMLKLAAVICVQESARRTNTEIGDHYTLTPEHVKMAIYIIDYYGQYFQQLYSMDTEDVVEQLISVLSGPPKTVNDIAKTSVIKGQRSARLWQIRKLLEDPAFLGELDSRGLFLSTAQGGKTRKTQYYQISEIPEHQEVESPRTTKVTICTATHNNQEEPKGYSTHVECEFGELHEHICKENSWAPKLYQDNYRNGDNRIPGEQLLVFDIDNGVEDPTQWLTIDEAHRRYSNYVHLIIPTRSHLKEKSGKPARPKFRIIFLLSSPMNMKNRARKNVVELCAKELQLHFPKGVCDITATSTANEAWIGAYGEPLYNFSGKLFNWRVGGYRAHLHKDAPKQKVNNIDPHTTIRIKNEEYTVQQAMSYVMGHPNKKIPCHCPNPAHDDKNASAWLQINDNGNMMIACSGGCETKYFDIN